MFIDTIINNSENRGKLSKRIEKLYFDYIQFGNIETYNKMLQLLDSYCENWVRAQLKRSGCYTLETEEDALQESRMAVWTVVKNDYQNKKPRNAFSYYAFNIYKHKTFDEIRKIVNQRKRYGDKSLDDSVGDNNVSMLELIPTETLEETEMHKEEQSVYSKLFFVYCVSFTESTSFPPSLLALYYARVLPHLLQSIPDTKGTSAKWALETMGDMKIWELKNDSELSMERLIDANLKWCNEFVEQIEENINIAGKYVKLADIIYTKIYNKGKIEDWADYMHKATIKKAMKRILQDQRLLALVKTHISNSDTLYRFVDGGKYR